MAMCETQAQREWREAKRGRRENGGKGNTDAFRMAERETQTKREWQREKLSHSENFRQSNTCTEIHAHGEKHRFKDKRT